MVLAKIPFERQFDIQPPADCRLESRGHSAHWALMKSTQSSDHRLCILVGHANNVITLWCEDEHLYFSSHEAARIAEAMAWTETIGWLARSILRVQSHSNGQSNHLFNLLPFRDGPLTPCDPDLRLIRLSFRSVHNRRPDADGHRPQAVRVSCVSTGAAFRMAPPPDAPKTGVMSIEDWAGLDREPMPSAEGDPDSVDIPMGGSARRGAAPAVGPLPPRGGAWRGGNQVEVRDLGHLAGLEYGTCLFGRLVQVTETPGFVFDDPPFEVDESAIDFASMSRGTRRIPRWLDALRHSIDAGRLPVGVTERGRARFGTDL